MAKQERLKTIWYRMKDRCYNKKHISFKYYGARGIKICDEWRNDYNVFKEWALSHGYSDELTIDRRNTHGNYDPQNCSWKTKKEQQANRRDSVKGVYNGKLLNAAEICDITGKSYHNEYIKIKRLTKKQQSA